MASNRLILGAAVAALTGALVLVVLLMAQRRELEERHRQLLESATSAQPGLHVPPVPVATLDGDTVTLGSPAGDAPQVLLFYTSTCPHCLATVPVWNRIAEAAVDARVIGVQLDSAPAGLYRAEHHLQYEVVAVDSAIGRGLTRWYRVRTVPLTLVVRTDGRVAYSRFGRIEDEAVGDSVVAAVEAAARQVATP